MNMQMLIKMMLTQKTLEKPNFSFSITNYIDFYIVNFALKYSDDIKLQYLLMYLC